MFRCKACSGSEFSLLLHPDFQGEVEITVNDHDDVMVRVNTQVFVADLAFMNQFALCKDCGAKRQWEYHYPNVKT